MFAMWCWLQPFGQPDILMWTRLVSGSVDLHRLDPLLDRPVEAHRGGDPELAAVGAGAGDDVGDLVGAGVAEAELAEPLPDVVDRLVADPAQDEVLVHGRAGVAAGVLAHDLRRGRGTARG